MHFSIEKEALRLHISRCVEDLPALPDVVTRVLELTDKPNSTASELEKAIGTDQALSGKLLRVVNSAFYGSAGKVSTISHAVMVLGIKQLRNLTLSVAAMSLVKARMPHMAEHQRAFWRHSLGVGAGAAAVAKKMRLGKDVGDEVFTGGLLHDIGRLFLLGYFFEFFVEILRTIQEEELPVFVAERRLLGMDHQEIGVMLGRHWHFPPPLLAAIERHHGPLLEDEFLPVAACVHLADSLADQVLDEPVNERADILPEAMQWSGFSDEDLEELRCEIREKVAAAEEFIASIKAA